jgi:hypothetical protein
MMPSPIIRDQQTAKIAGVVLLSAGAYLLYDAYEARGASRPFWTRLLPG